MKFSLELLESNQYIRQEILQALSKQIQTVFNKSIVLIKKELPKIIEASLKQEPEYSSLTGGKLRLEFGIPNTSSVDDIVSKLSNTVNIKQRDIKITNFGLSGGLDITAIESRTFNGLLSDDSAMVADTQRGYSLPWLEWLLLKGNQIIIKKYDVKFGPSKSSRTGEAVMIESDKNWRVPAEFAGTVSSNWTTRAIERSGSQILNLIQKSIEANL